MPVVTDTAIAIIGIGYVGLPLAFALARHHDVAAFDLDSERIRELHSGLDRNAINGVLSAMPTTLCFLITLESKQYLISNIAMSFLQNCRPDRFFALSRLILLSRAWVSGPSRGLLCFHNNKIPRR